MGCIRVNRPKRIGTAGESAVKRYAQANGFPGAERLPLSGSKDIGDVSLAPGVMVEVKAGKSAQNASAQQITDWLEETERERVNGGWTIALLVTQSRGFGPGRVPQWNARFLRGSDIVECAADAFIFNYPIAVSLEHALLMLRRAGWGNPITD
jgi:hypothetical protein